MTDQNAGGWPDPTRPGVPLNPERDGAHRLRHMHADQEWDVLWLCGGTWLDGSGSFSIPHAAAFYTYLGPCLTPAEIAAREEAAAVAMREAAAAKLDGEAADLEAWALAHPELAEAEPDFWNEQHARYNRASNMAEAIRALPLPTAALDAALERAREEGVEALCAARPDVAALLAGEAVAVPREATPEMLNAAREWAITKYGRGIGQDAAIGCYRAMLAASPYAQEPRHD